MEQVTPERLDRHEAARLQPELRDHVRRRRRHRHAAAADAGRRDARRGRAHGPIRYLINTEHHVDHIFGNYWFKGAGAVVEHQGVYDNFMVVDARSRPVRLRQGGDPDRRPGRRRHLPGSRRVLRRPEQGHDRLHRRPDAARRRPHLPPAPHAGTYARASSPSTSPRSASSSPATRSSPSARPG